jgi:hypothetical protein
MDAALATRIERNVDWMASFLFAAACGFAAYQWFAISVGGIALLVQSAAVAAFALVAGLRMLGLVQPEQPRLPVPIFDLRRLDVEPLPELLLTDRVDAEEPLELVDALATIEPDARVVRLFDPAAMPTAGQLNQRIESHLGSAARSQSHASADASQALHDALDELRRSLR